MSHEIDQLAPGIHAAAFARIPAWHRLGVTLDGTFTADEALTAAHLKGWNVRTLPLTATEITEDGVTTITVPEKFATVRTNPVTQEVQALGVVGDRYRPIQNEAHVELLDTLVDESGAHFDTAGAIRGGRQTFVSMKLPEHIKIGGIDEVDMNLVAINSHDGTSAFSFLVSPVRVVCQNTLDLARRSARASFSIRHTSGAHGRVQEAREALGMTFKYVDEFQKLADQMVSTTITAGWFDQFVRDLYKVTPTDTADDLPKGTRIAVEQLRSLWENSRTLDGIKDTRWGAYNVVTEYLDHFAPIRVAGDKDTARALRAATHKGTRSLKADAFQLALA